MATQLHKTTKLRHLIDLPRLAGEQRPSEESAQWRGESGVSSNDESPVDSVVSCEDRQVNKSQRRPNKPTKEALRGDMDGLAHQAYRSLNLAQPTSPRKQRPLVVDYNHSVVDVPMSRAIKPQRPNDGPLRNIPAPGWRYCPKARSLPARHDSLAWDGKRRSRVDSIPDVENESSEDVDQVLKRKDSGAQLTELKEGSLRAAEKAAQLDEVYYRAVLRACKLGRSRGRAASQPAKPFSPWAHPDCPPDPLYHPEIASALASDLVATQSRPMTPQTPAQSSQMSLAKWSDEEEVPDYIKQLVAHGLIDKKDTKHWNVRTKSGGNPKNPSKSSRNGKSAGHALRGLLKKPQAASVRSLSLSS
ncbi:hypothetical protein EJ03DRAFT_325017 [Teratosphaeria nubilosa]|uniref:Uncharacterized protein n=1 Tax=Teratosphaeria nubilosa TaxID=161662 RepID=A0A6G1LIE3_9PEZI|nr:hypothetical protein EJ03DRAFT_325017 [Teratosphaeria nubilosa]